MTSTVQDVIIGRLRALDWPVDDILAADSEEERHQRITRAQVRRESIDGSGWWLIQGDAVSTVAILDDQVVARAKTPAVFGDIRFRLGDRVAALEVRVGRVWVERKHVIHPGFILGQALGRRQMDDVGKLILTAEVVVDDASSDAYA